MVGANSAVLLTSLSVVNSAIIKFKGIYESHIANYCPVVAWVKLKHMYLHNKEFLKTI